MRSQGGGGIQKLSINFLHTIVNLFQTNELGMSAEEFQQQIWRQKGIQYHAFFEGYFRCNHPSNQVDDATLRKSHPYKSTMLKHGTLEKIDLELEQPTTNPWPHFFAQSKGH